MRVIILHCYRCQTLSSALFLGIISYFIYTTMPFTFVYRTADTYLCAIRVSRGRRDISCSVHKFEWHSMYNRQVPYFNILKGGLRQLSQF